MPTLETDKWYEVTFHSLCDKPWVNAADPFPVLPSDLLARIVRGETFVIWVADVNAGQGTMSFHYHGEGHGAGGIKTDTVMNATEIPSFTLNPTFGPRFAKTVDGTLFVMPASGAMERHDSPDRAALKAFL